MLLSDGEINSQESQVRELKVTASRKWEMDGACGGGTTAPITISLTKTYHSLYYVHANLW